MPATSSGGHGGGSQNNTNTVKRRYCRENTITVDVLDNGQVKPDNIIKFVHEHCGFGAMFACVSRSGNLYEVTLDGRAPIQYLLEGIKIGEKIFECTEVVQTSIMVSFLHLPAYIDDEEIENTLEAMKVEMVSPIKRRFYPGTNIADGTRYVRVKLPPNMSSFPYTIKFRKEYYRVIHNGQMKVCSLCYSGDHLFRACPKFVCFRCKKQGHYARTCTEQLCRECLEWGDECSCQSSEREVEADDGPLEEVNKEDEEGQERETEIEMEETQKDEGVREDRGETNEDVMKEDFEKSSTVKENEGKVSEPPDQESAGAVRDQEKENEPMENEATTGEKTESSESSEPDDEIVIKGKTKRKKKVKKGRAKKNK